MTEAEKAATEFSYYKPTEDQLPKYEALRLSARDFASQIIDLCPASEERTAALRKVREAVMTANSSIALEGKSF